MSNLSVTSRAVGPSAERYGSHTARYNRFVHWWAAGIWAKLPQSVAAASGGGIVMIDSSYVRVH